MSPADHPWSKASYLRQRSKPPAILHFCHLGLNTHHLQRYAGCHAPSSAEGCWEVEQPCTQAGVDYDEDGPKCGSCTSAQTFRRGFLLILGVCVHTGTLQQTGPLPSIRAEAPLAKVTVDADLGHGPGSPLPAGSVDSASQPHLLSS